MVIQVNAEYRITSDPSCWTVEHLKGTRKDGSERWEPVSYHCEFKSALVSLAEYRIRCIDSSAPEGKFSKS